jgi:U3 small nucleolar RNA-associated protein 3
MLAAILTAETLITYATTLAFYIHLCALPPDSRPDMASHPILTRLLQLKEGVAMLEDLDFAAGESSDVDPLEDGERTEEDEELARLMKNSKAGIMMQQIAATKGGAGRTAGAGAGDEEDEEDEVEGYYDEEEDMQGLWHTAGLEDGELDDLLADVGAEDAEEEAKMNKKSKVKEKKSKEGKKEKKDKKDKKKKTEAVDLYADDASMEDDDDVSSAHQFTPLEEPAFFSASKKTKSKDRTTASDDILGDPTALNEADATDKERRKRSLQFHTSKIASTSARRAAARAQRLGGDEDIPHRDRQAARDAALRKNSQGGVGEDLDGSEWTEKDKKRAREVRDEDGDDADGDDGDAYYDLVKRRKTDKQEAKEAAHEEFRAAKLCVILCLCLIRADRQRLVRGRVARRRTSSAHSRHREEQGPHASSSQDGPEPPCQEEAGVREGEAEGRLAAGCIQGRTGCPGRILLRREDRYQPSHQVEEVLGGWPITSCVDRGMGILQRCMMHLSTLSLLSPSRRRTPFLEHARRGRCWLRG